MRCCHCCAQNNYLSEVSTMFALNVLSTFWFTYLLGVNQATSSDRFRHSFDYQPFSGKVAVKYFSTFLYICLLIRVLHYYVMLY